MIVTSCAYRKRRLRSDPAAKAFVGVGGISPAVDPENLVGRQDQQDKGQS
jgi:hypothetical protein